MILTPTAVGYRNTFSILLPTNRGYYESNLPWAANNYLKLANFNI